MLYCINNSCWNLELFVSDTLTGTQQMLLPAFSQSYRTESEQCHVISSRAHKLVKLEQTRLWLQCKCPLYSATLNFPKTKSGKKNSEN